MSETIIYKGIRFRRYPESPHKTHQRYYNPGPTDRGRGVDSLHREIWKDTHGEIPEGAEIHHRDGNPLNNDISNLEMRYPAEHRQLHQADIRAACTTPEHLAHLEAIREKAAEWRRSPEGKEWHEEHGRQTWGHREAQAFICVGCGTEFKSKAFGLKAGAVGRFCSTPCSQRYHLRQKTFLKERMCPICQEPFRAPPRRETCSRECGARLRWDRTGRTNKP